MYVDNVKYFSIKLKQFKDVLFSKGNFEIPIVSKMWGFVKLFLTFKTVQSFRISLFSMIPTYVKWLSFKINDA